MKNRFLKLCSLVLVIVLLANMLPMNSFAEEFRESLAATKVETEVSADTSSAEIVEEITEKRTQYTKEFLLFRQPRRRGKTHPRYFLPQ